MEFDVIWMRAARGARGPEPSHTLDEIAAAAVRVADAEGIEAVSMRRIASEIGSGTTSLYRYVRKKEDLFNLMLDEVIGKGGRTEKTSGRVRSWRAALSALAFGLRGTFLRHPWMGSLLASRATLGPNRLRAAEQTLSVMDGLSLDVEQTISIIETLLAFVRGFAMGEIADQGTFHSDKEAWSQANAAYARFIIESGKYPRIARVMQASDYAARDEQADRRFRTGVKVILDGFERVIGSRRQSRLRAHGKRGAPRAEA